MGQGAARADLDSPSSRPPPSTPRAWPLSARRGSSSSSASPPAAASAAPPLSARRGSSAPPCSARGLARPPWSARGGGLAAAARRVLDQLCTDRLNWDPLAGPGELKGFSIFQSVDSWAKEELMRLAERDVRCQRAIGAMVGMAAADSVGGRLEFLPVGHKGSRFDPKTAKVIGEFNKFGLKPGQWTDDTSMGLCLADSLLACGGYDGSDLRLRFWNWWNRGYNNAFRYDSTRDQSVGLGGNVALSFVMMCNNPTSRFEGLGDHAGNGSLMRLAPVPIYFHASEDLALRVSAESSYSTHPAQDAADSCAFLGFVVSRAITRDAKWFETAAGFLDRCAADYLALPEAASQEALSRLLRGEEAPGSTERCWNWRDPGGPYILQTLAARGSSYNGHPVSADYFGSYCLDALAIALHSVYHTKSLMAALTQCVNHLGDADSTGSVCGQIAGAFYGAAAVDARIVADIRRWDAAGEIPLRGALLFALGSGLSEVDRAKARACSRGALAWDREQDPGPELPSLPPEPLRGLPGQPRKSIRSSRTPTLLRQVQQVSTESDAGARRIVPLDGQAGQQVSTESDAEARRIVPLDGVARASRPYSI